MNRSCKRILIPTGIAAALDDRPEQNFTGFASGDTVIASLAKHVSLIEAEDLVEGAAGYTPQWFLDDVAEAEAEEDADLARQERAKKNTGTSVSSGMRPGRMRVILSKKGGSP